MQTPSLKAPFPYFGGKRMIADKVWRALGNPAHYIEPFFGSGAVLLNRPHYVGQTETVCDIDGHVANVWRALQFAPDDVARWCDWPVNHVDLNARRAVLVANGNRLADELQANPEFYDAKLAGYWIWAASCWIGSGLTRKTAMPHVSNIGKGVHGQRPHVSDIGKGVHGQRPRVGHGGMGVHKPYAMNVYEWFRMLSERLRRVRTVCGDWTRVCGGEWQDNMGTVGMFFDPPYGVSDRTDVYAHDSTDVAHAVREWCLERGANPAYRIVLAGYDEHAELLEAGWRSERWSANGGYAKLGSGQGRANSHRETLYYSPHCITHATLFD